MRTFIAFNVSKENKEKLIDYKDSILPQIEKARFINPENIHLTMEFLGEIDFETAKKVKKTISKIDFKAFKLTFNKLGTFKKKDYLLWIGCDDCDKILNLHKNINKDLKKLGLETDTRPFKPHITIARNLVFKEGFTLENLPDLEFTQEFKEFRLYWTEFTKKGVTYHEF